MTLTWRHRNIVGAQRRPRHRIMMTSSNGNIHFPRYWPFVRGIHRSPVNSPHKGQWRGALVFSLICVRINGWVNNREAGDFRRYRAHYDVTVIRKAIPDFIVTFWHLCEICSLISQICVTTTAKNKSALVQARVWRRIDHMFHKATVSDSQLRWILQLNRGNSVTGLCCPCLNVGELITRI